MPSYSDLYLKNLTSSEIGEINILLDNWGLNQTAFHVRIDKWFQNFTTDGDKRLAHKLLLNLDYFNPESVEKKIRSLFIPIQEYLKSNDKSELDILIAIPDEKGDSATRSSYDIIKLWNLTQEQIFEIKSLRQQYLENKIIIFFNDTHGSGDQFIRTIYPKIKDVPCICFITCLSITQKAIDNFQSTSLTLTILPNAPSKNIYDVFDAEEIDRLTKLGRLVYPAHPVGYGGVGLLTAYYYQCPNNTLPIVWADGSNNRIGQNAYKWNPLFRYIPKRRQKEMSEYQIKKLLSSIPDKVPVPLDIAEVQKSLITIPPSINFNVLSDTLTRDIAAGNKIQISKQLEKHYSLYKQEYKTNGNPIAIYNKITPFLFTVEELLPEKTMQIGKFHWFLSYLLINSDHSKEVLGLARSHSDKAINILENADHFNTEVYTHLVKSYWLRALSYKMQGHLSEAHRMLTDTISELEKDNVGSYFDMLYLHRQRTLIEEQKESYEDLLNRMSLYKYDSIESYYTSKRIFEFTLNSKNQKDFEKYFLLSREHYRKAAPYLEQVYRFSYWKYLFIYFKYTKKNDLADRIYNYLLNGSIKKQLYGQERTLKSLKEMFND